MTPATPPQTKTKPPPKKQPRTQSSMQFGSEANCRQEECIGKMVGDEDPAENDKAAESRKTGDQSKTTSSMKAKTTSSMKVSKRGQCSNGECIGLD